MDEILAMARRLVEVDGVVAVCLGGSRARGTRLPGSDVDLGLYYRPPLDTAALGELATAVTGTPVPVTAVEKWGPWVDGGAWLRVGDQPVDWIYRDLDRVRRVWADCLAGRYEVAHQPGHPLGFYSCAYAGELALGRVLADPSGEVTALRQATRRYPAELRRRLVAAAGWEPAFLIANAAKGAVRGDSCYVAGCLFRAVGVLAQALHADAGRWLVNEKGAIPGCGGLSAAPPDFVARATRLLAAVGDTPDALAATLDAAERLVEDVRAALAGGLDGWGGGGSR